MRRMPWKATDKVSERMQFISRLERGERMVDLCREFGVSRKTGYKLKARFERYGPSGLYDQSRRPHVHPRKTPDALVQLVIEARQEFPSWGPKKLHVLLGDRHPGVKLPCPSTMGVIVKDAGLVAGRKKRRRCTPTDPRCVQAQAPNQVWTVDFKGQFRLQNQKYCYPLTLSVWLLRLGISLQRIEPGKPQQNGCHERFHRTLKAEATRPSKSNLLAQQERFDEWRQQYNDIRPHESLGQKTPASVYTQSTVPMPDNLEPLRYPLCDKTVMVSRCGSLRFNFQTLKTIPRPL